MKMSPVSDAFAAIVWVFLNSPIAQISNFITNLPITSDYTSYLTPPQTIKLYGYPAESHTIQTEDGYILELHRIPYGKSGKGNETRIPVLLHHGILCSSSMWLINEPEKSLACRLADEGYDVWMGNARGNTFSKAHIKYTPEQKGFWNFGFHEFGIYDLPASIDYILDLTKNQRLFYIGHSLGSLVFLIMSSVLPEYNDKIIATIGFAPGTAIPHTKSILFRSLVPLESPLKNLWEQYTNGSLFEHDVMMETVDKYICPITIFNLNFCELFILIAFGWDPQQYNSTSNQNIYASVFSGTSIKTVIQVAQYIQPGLLSNYDYGKEGNINRYGSTTPPLYDLSKVEIPVKIYYGGNDIVIVPKDVEALYQKLPNTVGLVKINEFSHLDFYTAMDINTLLYDDVIKTIHNFTKSSYIPHSDETESIRTPLDTNIDDSIQVLHEMIPSSSESLNFESNTRSTSSNLDTENDLQLTRIDQTGTNLTEHFEIFLPNKSKNSISSSGV